LAYFGRKNFTNPLSIWPAQQLNVPSIAQYHAAQNLGTLDQRKSLKHAWGKGNRAKDGNHRDKSTSTECFGLWFLRKVFEISRKLKPRMI